MAVWNEPGSQYLDFAIEGDMTDDDDESFARLAEEVRTPAGVLSGVYDRVDRVYEQAWALRRASEAAAKHAVPPQSTPMERLAVIYARKAARRA